MTCCYRYIAMKEHHPRSRPYPLVVSHITNPAITTMHTYRIILYHQNNYPQMVFITKFENQSIAITYNYILICWCTYYKKWAIIIHEFTFLITDSLIKPVSNERDEYLKKHSTSRMIYGVNPNTLHL